MNTSDNAELSVRSYQHGDEETLIDLWARAYSDYGGHVPKNPEYWRWCVLERPGVEAEDVVLLEHQDTLIAYGVLGRKESPVGPGGTVLELAVEPSLTPAERTRSVSQLISVLEERSRARGDEIFEVSVPSTEQFMVGALEAADFKPEKSDSMQLVIVDVMGLMQKILERRGSEIAAIPAQSFAFIIQQEEYRALPLGRIRMELSSSGVSVEESAVDADFEVVAELSSLLDIIFRRDDVANIIRDDRIRVQPETGADALARLLRLLAIRSNWYTPSVDGR